MVGLDEIRQCSLALREMRHSEWDGSTENYPREDSEFVLSSGRNPQSYLRKEHGD